MNIPPSQASSCCRRVAARLAPVTAAAVAAAVAAQTSRTRAGHLLDQLRLVPDLVPDLALLALHKDGAPCPSLGVDHARAAAACSRMRMPWVPAGPPVSGLAGSDSPHLLQVKDTSRRRRGSCSCTAPPWSACSAALPGVASASAQHLSTGWHRGASRLALWVRTCDLQGGDRASWLLPPPGRPVGCLGAALPWQGPAAVPLARLCARQGCESHACRAGCCPGTLRSR